MAGRGVLEDGKRVRSEVGTVQGGSVSPLLANIYLHYVLDLWAQQWRKTQAQGDMSSCVLPMTSSLVRAPTRGRAIPRGTPRTIRAVGLELHPDKTRLIEFGRHADKNRRDRGDGNGELQLSGSRTSAGKPEKLVHGAAADDAPKVAGKSSGGANRTETTLARPVRKWAPTCARSSRGTTATTGCP